MRSILRFNLTSRKKNLVIVLVSPIAYIQISSRVYQAIQFTIDEKEQPKDQVLECDILDIVQLTKAIKEASTSNSELITFNHDMYYYALQICVFDVG